MKVCNVCGVQKDFCDFHKDKRNKDGHSGRCKPCAKAYMAAYRAKNAGSISTRARDYREENWEAVTNNIKRWLSTEGGQEKSRAIKKRHRQKHPERFKARTELGKALREGRVSKPLSCEHPPCGKVGEVEGHHVDYGRPLMVVWLCKKCHTAVHRSMK